MIKLKNILKKFPYIKNFVTRLNNIELEIDTLKLEIDALKSKIDIDDNLFDKFQKDKYAENYQSIYKKENPLVTVCIGTYNRGYILIERALKSILNQDYNNIELIIVGDGCTDDTEQLVSKIKYKQLKFINLPKQNNYPKNPFHKWMVAGTIPFNYALNLAKGDFITHLDDDDEFIFNRISKLVKFIQETQADLVWHPFWEENENDKNQWKLNKTEYFKKGYVTTSSVFYHHWFKEIPWDIDAFKYLEPGDWNRFRKIKYLGAKIIRYPEPLLKHYKERQNV
ncbi:MAG: glycosyltransferase family 2 protein [Armatimonadetes bacterium]|nr:glycosyltransferase family 2 protein [Armatimonadota bacterium]